MKIELTDKEAAVLCDMIYKSKKKLRLIVDKTQWQAICNLECLLEKELPADLTSLLKQAKKEGLD